MAQDLLLTGAAGKDREGRQTEKAKTEKTDKDREGKDREDRQRQRRQKKQTGIFKNVRILQRQAGSFQPC